MGQAGQHRPPARHRVFQGCGATDPMAPYWSMCFAGMQLFINFSSPAHRQRKSRNLGRHFLFIVNPRERFDIVAGDTPEGNRVRQVIRDRAEAYDGIPHAPSGGNTASPTTTATAPTAARSKCAADAGLDSR